MSTQNAPIFALDIGTRSVVGILLEPHGEHQYKVIGMEIEEHQERSMLDGQIHDVVAVAQVIQRVKQRLEEKHGTLEQVAVAAAGRSLLTHRLRLDIDITNHPPITAEEIRALELSAVQQAQIELAQMKNVEDRTHYYCVGYSVVQYLLDDSPIGNLIDQRGESASVEIIATFLPRIVVDNLIAALKRADLSMAALTLEPIAAIHVLIPATMRRLNIALVDIGAGTSDIAITEGGTITAYGMVPIAGDEITDAIMQAFLLDFPVAERIKRELNTKDKITFSDILGIEYEYTSEEIVQSIRVDIEKLAKAIGHKILELNGKAPQAVLLVGGGSLTPKIGPILANILGLPEQRVGVRGVEAVSQLVSNDEGIHGPELVTPVGIAVTAKEHPVQYLSVQLNGKTYRFFDLRQMTVGDVLIASGSDVKKLFGRPGLGLTLKINNKVRMFPGTHGTPPTITVNGEPAIIDTPIRNGDHITVTPGVDGTSPKLTVKDVIEDISTLDLIVNEEPISISPIPYVNGQMANWDALLKERDEVVIVMPQTLNEIAEEIGLKEPFEKKITYTINGERKEYSILETTITINDRPATLQSPIHTGDHISIRRIERTPPTVAEVLPVADLQGLTIRVTFNGQVVHIPTTELVVMVDGQQAPVDSTIHDGAVIVYEHRPLGQPSFSDVFRYVEYTPPAFTPGIKIQIICNGEPTNLDQPLKDGDVLEIGT